MDFRIIEKPSFTVVGRALRVTTKEGENMRLIPQFWEECHRDGSYDQLAALAERGVVFGAVTLGLCLDFTANMEEFTYMIATEWQGRLVPDGMAVRTIAAVTWAVFEATGPLPDAVQFIWRGLWSEFFPSTQFAHADGPDLEVYPSGDPTRSDYHSEVWIPIATA